MCHFFPVHHFGMACLAGSKVNIQHYHTLLEIVQLKKRLKISVVFIWITKNWQTLPLAATVKQIYYEFQIQEKFYKPIPFKQQILRSIKFALYFSYGRWLIYLVGGLNIVTYGVRVKAIDCGIVVSEFELQSCYNVHFRTNTLGKSMNPLILPVKLRLKIDIVSYPARAEGLVNSILPVMG